MLILTEPTIWIWQLCPFPFDNELLTMAKSVRKQYFEDGAVAKRAHIE
jgi:hypothetical protein